MMQKLLLLLTFVLLSLSPVLSRTAIVREWIGAGTRNVRRQTTAFNVIDSNGRVVQDRSHPEGGRGSHTYGCVDIRRKLRRNGEVYTRADGYFKYRCKNGTEEIVACFGTERAGHAEIRVGDTFTRKGFWHRCTLFKANHTAVYTEEAECNVAGNTYPTGTDVFSGYLHMRCEQTGWMIIGCVYRDMNNEYVDMKPGSTDKVGNVVHRCDRKGDTLEYSSDGGEGTCTKNGHKFRNGEQFSASHLNYECRNGQISIKSCYISEDEDLPIGTDKITINMVFRCFKQGIAVNYEEYACGYPGTPSCDPRRIGGTSAGEASISKHGFGFQGFSLMQRIDKGSRLKNGGSDSVQLRFMEGAGKR